MKKIFLLLSFVFVSFILYSSALYLYEGYKKAAAIHAENEKIKQIEAEKQADIEKAERAEEKRIADSVFTRDDVIAMRDAGVRIALIGEKNSHIISESFIPNELVNVEILDFNGVKIYTLPDFLFKFVKLRKLVLHDAGLSSTNEVLKLKALKSLEVLHLSNNSLKNNTIALTALWSALPELRQLYLSNCGVGENVFGDFAGLNHLIQLDLSKNYIKHTEPLNLNKLESLEKLNLADNELAEFHLKSISMLSIEQLDLRKNLLQKLPFEGDMPQLGSLYLSENYGTDKNSDLVIDDEYGGLFVVKKIAQLSTSKNTKIPVSLRKKLLRNNGSMIGRYKINGDGTVIDVKTKLQWMQCSIGQTFVEEETGYDLFACVGKSETFSFENLPKKIKFAGHNDWRVPTIDELKTLVYCSSGQPIEWNNTGEECQGSYVKPTIFSEVFPADIEEKHFWSSSPYAGSSYYVWVVNFYNGYSSYYGNDYDYHVRLVR